MSSHKVPDFWRVKLDSQEYKVYNMLVESFLIWDAKFRVYFTKKIWKSKVIEFSVNFYFSRKFLCKMFQISMYKVSYLIV